MIVKGRPVSKNIVDLRRFKRFLSSDKGVYGGEGGSLGSREGSSFYTENGSGYGGGSGKLGGGLTAAQKAEQEKAAAEKFQKEIQDAQKRVDEQKRAKEQAGSRQQARDKLQADIKAAEKRVAERRREAEKAQKRQSETAALKRALTGRRGYNK